ncbi:hypothetical protein ScFU29_00540 [Streptococcus canis]|nr:hypothetical protein ScFU29_00540 [Streptococcus canis]
MEKKYSIGLDIGTNSVGWDGPSSLMIIRYHLRSSRFWGIPIVSLLRRI